MTHSEGKKTQSTETNLELTMLEFTRKDFTTITMTIVHMFKKLEERLTMLRGDCLI